MPTDILTDLNPQQKQAVKHDKGPLLIIAGAGTGKTTVITRRIAWLVNQKKAKPEEILALTFTDKAAAEMEERVDILVPYGYTDMWVMTFHAFGDRVLRENALELGLNPDFKVLTRPEAIVFFREHLFEFDLKYYRPLSDPTRFIDALINVFSRAKDEDVSPQEYLDYAAKLKKTADKNDAALAEEIIKHTEIARAYQKYQELLEREGKIDFGNQFYLTLQLFRKRPSVLKYYHDKFKYILVDEFQDTNFAQFELVKLLAQKHKNITVVSDDDQSIYKFRGAAVSNIINFIDFYPEAKKISLTQNYRSTQVILDSAYKLIQNNNPDRLEVRSKIDKHLMGLTKAGKSIEHLYFDTVSSEADSVAQIIKEKVDKEEFDYSDFAILVRSNNDADPFLRSLNMRGIPWRFSGNQGLYTQAEVRLCIAFLRLMANLEDSLSLFYLASSEIYDVPLADLTICMNYSRRRVSGLFHCLEHLERIPELSGICDEAAKTIKRLVKDINKYIEASATHSTGRLLYLFLTDTGYIKNLVKNPSLANEEKLQNLAKFFELVRDFELLAREDRVVYFIQHLDTLIQSGDDPATVEADMDTPAVNVLTVHKAKGLEFSVVFLVSLVAGKFPWPRRREPIEFPDCLIKDILPSGDFQVQEERRLFYVAMTRAKKELYFTSARDYGGLRRRRPSQFIYEAQGITPEEETLALKKTEAVEVIQRFAGVAKSIPVPPSPKPQEPLYLSFYQVDDYLTCPLKYKYVHILRVPIMEHQTVLYGSAMHNAILKYYQYKMKAAKFTEKALIEAFDAAFRPEGFLSKEHKIGRVDLAHQALRRFYQKEQTAKSLPAFVEKEFSFMLDSDRIRGRWDRIDIQDSEAIIIDFKSSEIKKQEDADERAKKSLQMSIYALAYKEIFGKMPKAIELHFLESGLVGRAKKTEKDLESAAEKIKEASSGIKKAQFQAKPTYLACNYCAYSQVCPSCAPLKRA